MTAWGGGVSKSATKAPRAGIGWEEKRGISTILFARSGSMGAFVADLDILRRHGVREGRQGPDGDHDGRSGEPTGSARAAAPDSSGVARRRDVHFAFESAVPTVVLESKMHLSTRRGSVAAAADCGDNRPEISPVI